MARKIVLDVEGIAILGWLYLPDIEPPYPAVCVCHGIPARVREPDDNGYALLAEEICREGFAVMIFNFRGTGASGGNLDIMGWTRDLKGVLDYLYTVPEIDKSHLSLFGFSGGAAVSVYVAAQEKRISCVAACACPAEFSFISEVDDPQSVVDHFRSIGAIRDKNFPRNADHWLDGFRMLSPIKYVAGIAPRLLLIVHGSQDETVNKNDAHRLYDRAGKPKQIIIIDGVGHRLRQEPRAISVVIDWLKTQCRYG